LIYYVKTPIKRWVGASKVTSGAFHDETLIWEDASYAWRVKIKPLLFVNVNKGVPYEALLGKLRLFSKTKLGAEGQALRYSPRRMNPEDGELILSELKQIRGV